MSQATTTEAQAQPVPHESTTENPEIKPVDRFCMELQDKIVDNIDLFNFRNPPASYWRETYTVKHGSKWGETFERLLQEAEMRDYIKVLDNVTWEYVLDDDGNKVRCEVGERGNDGYKIHTFANWQLNRCFTIKWFKRRDVIEKWHRKHETPHDPRSKSIREIKDSDKETLNIMARGCINDYYKSHRAQQRIGINLYVRDMLVYRKADLEPDNYEAIVAITLGREKPTNFKLEEALKAE